MTMMDSVMHRSIINCRVEEHSDYRRMKIIVLDSGWSKLSTLTTDIDVRRNRLYWIYS